MTVEDLLGNIYVNDTDNYRIQKFDSAGNFIKVISGYGSANGQIRPNSGDLAIDSADNLYVIANPSTGRIDKFTSDGTYITSFALGSYPAGAGQITNQNHIEITNDGLLHVQVWSTIYTYNATTGTFVRTTNLPSFVGDFTSDGTRLYCVGSGTVTIINNGAVERTFSAYTNANDTHDGLAFTAYESAITVDSYGNIYIPGAEGSVGVFTNNGTFTHRFGSYMATYLSWGGMSRTLFMRVSSRNGAFYYNGDHDYISVSSAYTVTAPGAPQNVTASSAQTGGIINVSWQPPATDGGAPVYEYDIEIFTAPYGKWSRIATVAAPSNSATVHVPAGTYKIRVRARNSAGTSNTSSDTPDIAVSGPYAYNKTINVDPSSHITAIATDSTGVRYATDDYNSRVMVLDDTGATARTFGESDLSSPCDIALGPDNNLYVSDESWDKIFVYSKDGTLLRSFGTSGSADGELYSPSKINFDKNGNLLLVNYYTYNKIQRFDTAGNYLGRVAPQITTPQALGVDKDGNLYVGHDYSYISKLTPDGTTELFQIGGDGAGDGQFSEVINIVVNSQGQIIASDPWNGRIQIFNADGSYNSQIGIYTENEAFTGINSDGQLDIDASDNIYLSDPYIDQPSITIYASALSPAPGPALAPPVPAPIAPPAAPGTIQAAVNVALAATGASTQTLTAGAVTLLSIGLASLATTRLRGRHPRQITPRHRG